MQSSAAPWLQLPAGLRRQGLRLRPETSADLTFLEELYASTRLAEIAASGMPAGMQQRFLADQFRLQDQHYRTHYAEAARHIIQQRNQCIGRLYLWRSDDAGLRVIDISLLPERRGAGIGGQLLKAVQGMARSEGSFVSLNVFQGNPAARLYLRLGFKAVGGEPPYTLMHWRP